MDWLFEAWDAVELWLVQLPYPLLVALVLAVLVPGFWGLSQVINRVVDEVAARLTRVRDAEPPLGRNDVSGTTAAEVNGAS
jgi:hypothetical protein